MMKITKVFVFLLSLTLVTGAFAEDNEAKEEGKTASLEKELLEVQGKLAEARADMVERNAELWRHQHDIEYKDPKAAELREEIKELEKEMLQKRRALQARVSLAPEVRETEKERAELLRAIQRLQDEERVIIKEINLSKGIMPGTVLYPSE